MNVVVDVIVADRLIAAHGDPDPVEADLVVVDEPVIAQLQGTVGPRVGHRDEVFRDKAVIACLPARPVPVGEAIAREFSQEFGRAPPDKRSQKVSND